MGHNRRAVRFSVLILLPLLQAGCWRPFDSPDVHVRKAAQIPEEARHMKGEFRLPDDLTDVYYFSPAYLRCNYYLRGKLSKEGIDKYETDVLKHAKRLADVPRDVSGPDVTPIKDWWPQADSQNLDIYELRDLDFVMIDRQEGIVYVALCAD